MKKDNSINKTYDEIINQFIVFLEEKSVIDKKSKLVQLQNVLKRNNNQKTLYDEVIDFLDLINGEPTRWEVFGKYIKNHYPVLKHRKVLDIGSGPRAELARFLTSFNYDVIGVDPKIKDDCPIPYHKILFDYRDFDVTPYDLLVGLEPCDGAEHILYAGLNNDIPFCIDLCQSTHHKAIHTKTKFRTVNEYYEHLLRIANGNARIQKVKTANKLSYILRNK